MLKFNSAVSLFPAIVLIYLFSSCSKVQQENKNIPDVISDSGKIPDSIVQDITFLKDSISPKTNYFKQDSLTLLKKGKVKNDSLKALMESDVKITAYYFHPTARCLTCLNIEAYSYEAIQQWEEKNKKNIAWKELNIEDSLNEHYIDEFDLQFSSLIIVKYSDGKKIRWKNLEDTWKLVNDKNSFIKYVIYEINQFAKADK